MLLPKQLMVPPQFRPDGGVIDDATTQKQRVLKKGVGKPCAFPDAGEGVWTMQKGKMRCVGVEQQWLRLDAGTGKAANAASQKIRERANQLLSGPIDHGVSVGRTLPDGGWQELLDDGGIAPERIREPQKSTATLTIGGDVTLGYHYEEYFDDQVNDAGRPRDEMFGWGFKEVLPALDGGDLFIVNLECPFTLRGEKIPKNFNFRARPEFVNTLTSAGVDVVSLANNHLMDYGATGLLDTLDTLDAAKIQYFGAGRTLSEAREPRIVVVNGIKIAFLGYFFMGDRYIEPPEVIASSKTPGVAGDTKDTGELDKMMVQDIQSALGYADLVIPFFHWGREGMTIPEPYQVRLAHLAIDSGAAAVLGSHPHVLQGMELYKGAPVLYSLGNFVFGGNWNPKNKESVIVNLSFDRKGFKDAQLIPIYTDRYPEKPVQPYLVTGDQAAGVLRHLADYSSGFGQMLPALTPYASADAGR